MLPKTGFARQQAALAQFGAFVLTEMERRSIGVVPPDQIGFVPMLRDVAVEAGMACVRGTKFEAVLVAWRVHVADAMKTSARLALSLRRTT